MSAAEKANLARIRDNQRRSRARRKEYLQELESRLRQCELHGIEASAAIQLAARRVADENKKLRMLLSQQGVGDDSVEAYLQNTANQDPIITGSGFGDLRPMDSRAVQVLEQLLTTKKQCCTAATTGAQGPITTGGGSRDSSAGSMSTVQSIWDPSFSNQMSTQGDHISMNDSGNHLQHNFMTPLSNASRAGSAVTAGRMGNISIQQHQLQQQQQQPHQQHQPRNRGSSLAPSMASSISTATSTSQQTQPNYHYDAHPSIHPTFQSHHSHHQQQHHHHLAPLTQSSHYLPPTGRTATMTTAITSPPTPSSNTNSCLYATDLITTMAGGGDPQTVRAELGCTPNRVECEVNNQLVFNVMDRYTGPGLL